MFLVIYFITKICYFNLNRSQRKIDNYGREHVWMKFYVEGDLGQGIARMELVKGSDDSDFSFRYCFVDVVGKFLHTSLYPYSKC